MKTDVIARLQDFPAIPQTAEELMAFQVKVREDLEEDEALEKAGTEARPESTNVLGLPPEQRRRVLLALEQIGLDTGLIRHVLPESLKDAEKRKSKKREQWKRFLQFMESYWQRYNSVKVKLYGSKKEINSTIKALDQHIENLKKIPEGPDDEFSAVADPEGEIAKAQKAKDDLAKFRDNNLRKHQEKMESNDLPSEAELKSMEKDIDTHMSRFAKLKNLTLKAAKLAGRGVVGMAAGAYSLFKKPAKTSDDTTDTGDDETEGDDGGKADRPHITPVTVAAEPEMSGDGGGDGGDDDAGKGPEHNLDVA